MVNVAKEYSIQILPLGLPSQHSCQYHHCRAPHFSVNQFYNEDDDKEQ